MNKFVLAVLVLLVVCALAAFAGVVVVDRIQDLTRTISAPVVDIYSPAPDDELTTARSVMLQAVARDPDRISSLEFWLDGRLIKSEKSPWPEGITPLPLAHVARIDQAGEHQLVVRAADTHGNTGQASMMLNVVEGAAAAEPAPYVVQEGDTLDGIAQALGVAASEITDLNPGLSGELPAVGEELTLPVPPTEEPEVDLGPPVEPVPLLEPPVFLWDPPEVFPRWLPLPGPIGFPTPPPGPPEGLLDIALLEVDSAYDGVFCYVSAGDSPVIRTPTSGFLTHVDGNYWDIAEWFSGEDMLPLLSTTGSLRLRMNCVGFHATPGGGVVQDLGTLDITRPFSELGSGAISERTTGSHWFRVSFIIHPLGHADAADTTGRNQLILTADSFEIGEDPLWNPPHRLLHYDFFHLGELATAPELHGYLIYRNGALWRRAPLGMDEYPVWDHIGEGGTCGEEVEFFVVGYIGNPLHPDSTLESNHLRLSGYCPPEVPYRMVTVQFNWLKVACMEGMEQYLRIDERHGLGLGCLPDCSELEMLGVGECYSALDPFGPISYGGLNVNGRRVIQMGDGMIRFTPEVYRFAEGPWAAYYRYTTILSETEALWVSSDLWDYDVLYSDDRICGGAVYYSPDEILGLVQSARTDRRAELWDAGLDSWCTVSFEVSAAAVSP